MKKAVFIIVGIVVVLLFLGFVKDSIIKVIVEKGVETVTGLKLSINSIHVGITRSVVDIRGLKIYNPKDFKDRVMLEMPQIYVDYDLPAILGGNMHIRELRIDLKEFNVIKNADGKLNLNSLKTVEAQKKGESPAAGEEKPMKIQIDTFYLKADKAVYKDYSQGGAPSVKEFNVNLNEKYTNIQNPYALVSLIVVKVMGNTAIANLANFDLQGLQGTVLDNLGSAQKVFGQTTSAAQGTIQKTTTVAKEASDVVQKTAEGLKDVFKSPFGSK